MDANDILKAKKISHTGIREKILDIFLYKAPLTQKELMLLANFKLNRITLYRTLRAFLNKGVIVRIYDDKGQEKFFLNYENKKDHVHFKCIKCGKLFSFPGKVFKYRSLPKGYVAKEKKLFITGICNQCSMANA